MNSKIVSTLVILLLILFSCNATLITDEAAKLRVVSRIEGAIATSWMDKAKLKLSIITGKHANFRSDLPIETVQPNYLQYLVNSISNMHEVNLVLLLPELEDYNDSDIWKIRDSLEDFIKGAQNLTEKLDNASWMRKKLYASTVRAKTIFYLRHLLFRSSFLSYMTQKGNEDPNLMLTELIQIIEESKVTLLTAIKTIAIFETNNFESLLGILPTINNNDSTEQALVVNQLGYELCPECEKQRREEMETEHLWQDAYIKTMALLLGRTAAFVVFCTAIGAYSCTAALLVFGCKAYIIWTQIWIDSIKLSLGKWI